MTVRLKDVMDQIESQQAADSRREAHPTKFYANITFNIRFALKGEEHGEDGDAMSQETLAYAEALERAIADLLPPDADIRIVQQSHEGSA